MIELGDALREQNKFAEAESQYRQVLQTGEAFSNYIAARQGIADILERRNRLKESETEYRALLETSCGSISSSAYVSFGDFLGRRNRWKEAEAEYKRAVQLDPMEPKYRELLQQAINAQKK